MRKAEIARMFELEDTYWWFVARRLLVRDLLRRHPAAQAAGDREAGANCTGRPIVLDVGCGTGATLKVLRESGEVVGLDASTEALGYSRRRGHRQLVQARGEELPVASAAVEIVTALDLLEHIPDDGAALREFARVLRPGGLLILTVPAGPFLWSEHDEALDHLRRYRRAELQRMLEAAGFVTERLSPAIAALFLPIAALRLFQRVRRRKKGRPQTAFIIPPRPINWLLIALLTLENRCLMHFDLPLGVSLVAVARKP